MAYQRNYKVVSKKNTGNTLYSGNAKLGSTTSTPGRTVMNNTKKEQGYDLTTSYASKSNLTDRGYPTDYVSKGEGMTGSKLGSTSGSNYGVRSIGGSGSGSKSSGGSSSGYSAGGSVGTSDSLLYNMLREQEIADAYTNLLASYKKNDYSDYLEQMRQAARNAYDRGMSNLGNAYNSQMSSLANNLNSTKNQLLESLNRAKGDVSTDAENSLKQAYINRMMSQKNLGQQMSALGLSGGATETTLANMLNNYGNARNNINTTLNSNISKLEGNYNDSLAQANQAYNNAVASAAAQKAEQEMALENALANNEVSAVQDYANLMQREDQNYMDLLRTAVANGASVNTAATSADNGVRAIGTTQSTPESTLNKYFRIQSILNAQDQAQRQAAANKTVLDAATQNNYLAQILAQLA